MGREASKTGLALPIQLGFNDFCPKSQQIAGIISPSGSVVVGSEGAPEGRGGTAWLSYATSTSAGIHRAGYSPRLVCCRLLKIRRCFGGACGVSTCMLG